MIKITIGGKSTKKSSTVRATKNTIRLGGLLKGNKKSNDPKAADTGAELKDYDPAEASPEMVEQSAAETRVCPSCVNAVDAETSYCPICGTKID